MESIFRTATTQAILDIIAEHGTRSRFGHMLTDEDASAVAEQVVDLFEMTLRLRARTGLIGTSAAPEPQESRGQTHQSGGASGAQNLRGAQGAPNLRGAQGTPASRSTLPSARSKRMPSWTDEGPAGPFPKTVNASEFLEPGQRRPAVPEVAPSSEERDSFSFRLPRQRNTISEEERVSFLKRNR